MSGSFWARGDIYGLDIPADAAAMEEKPETFLTRVFHTSGALAADNRVTRVTRFEGFTGGGTGSKLLLDVEYEYSRPDLHRELFVKFSRNFDDPIRDRVRHMLKAEIEFAVLSREPGFPISVPDCYFADFHGESGTGLLITRRIPYGREGIELHYIKCMDHLIPDPVEHYSAIMKALARLAGTHKAGLLPQAFYREFPFNANSAVAEDPLRYRGEKLKRRLSRLAGFAEKYPRLLPEHIRSREFLERFAAEAVAFVEVEQQVRRYLFDTDDFIALCHWNANIDNAWFRRDEGGALECGLMDWGSVGQMNVAKSIYGAFSGADPEVWDGHLERMVSIFAGEFERAGGPALHRETLKRHILLFTALMGVAYLLDAPAIIEHRVADLDTVESHLDPRILDTEDARVQLHMLTMFLNQWQTRDIGRLIEDLEARRRHPCRRRSCRQTPGAAKVGAIQLIRSSV